MCGNVPFFFLLSLFIYNLSFYIIQKIVIGLKHKRDNSCRILCFFLNINSIGECQIPVPEKVQEKDEKSSEKDLNEDDRRVLEELISRSSNDGYIKFDIEFNKRLQDLARRWLAE